MKKIFLISIFIFSSQLSFSQDSNSIYETVALKKSFLKDTSQTKSSFIIRNISKNNIDVKSKVLGKISNLQNGRSLPGTNIWLKESKLFAVADSMGNYLFENVPSGNHTIKAAFIGHQSIETTLNVKENEIIIIDFQLAETIDDPSDFYEPPIGGNPFSVDPSLEYELSKDSQVDIKIFDIIGKLQRTISLEIQSKGKYKVSWDYKDDNGNIVKDGIYFIQIVIDGKNVKSKKMFLKSNR